ncbi:MAG: phage tail tube protein [Treponema sp.]|nr:phage tail tube protein [Treponema sp.]
MADGWAFMKAADAISGSEGTLYANIDGNVVAVAECKTISAKIQKDKQEFKALGYRGKQHKATGWSGTGSMTVYFVTSMWTKMILKYVKEGVDTYFKLTFTNEDPTAENTGKQVITLIDVNLDDAEIAKLDKEATFLDQQMNFTFSDIDMSEEFKRHKGTI